MSILWKTPTKSQLRLPWSNRYPHPQTKQPNLPVQMRKMQKRIHVTNQRMPLLSTRENHKKKRR